MNRRTIVAIIGKDIRVTLQSKAAIMPIVIVPLIFFIILPVVFTQVPQHVKLSEADFLTKAPFKQLIEKMPASIQRTFAAYSQEQLFMVIMTCYVFAPLFLILPLMVASIFAAQSFVGELERKTMEGLLYSPATDGELFIGKLCAAVIPALIVSWFGFFIYGITVNASGWALMHRLFFPNWAWIILMFWLVPAISTFGASLLVLISSRVKSFVEAQQLGGVLVVPILALLAAQLTGVLYLHAWVIILLGAIIWGITVLCILAAIRMFKRQQLIFRL